MVMDPNGPLIGWAWFEKLEAENARLKAEVERLTERNKFLELIDSYLQGANESAYEKRCDELEAEVERLRKAGDALAERLDIGFTEVPWKYGPKWYAWHSKAEASVNDWNAAKEGKQP